MLFATLAISALSLSSVLALPAAENHLDKRFSQLCGQWDTENEGGIYVLQNNLWGMSGATGSQCSQVYSQSGNLVGWGTTYSWSGNSGQVKSYANLALKVGLGGKLSSIGSIPSQWFWAYMYASSNLVANISYDLWLSNSSTGTGASSTSSYEIMIWLSTRGGASPAGSQIATVTINGMSWKLYKGTVMTWTVFSFVAPYEIQNYYQDLLPFLTYLTNNQGVSSDQYLVGIQAGTEPFTGGATVTTSAYYATVQVAPYKQCGGSGYTGPTTCVSGYTCTYVNTWWSQCN
ncbi:hypothetical protein FRC01_009607 [Tulasnella sp. 417]|nr:hypothetical protein FRC01_009607 [Tulasnella sp. 417]